MSNAQQMEVAVHGPDGATHLILCTGLANVSCVTHELFTFFVGPQLTRRQFVGVIASGALSTIQVHDISSEAYFSAELRVRLIAITADYNEEVGQVKVSAEITSGPATTKLAINYNVSILAELPIL